MGPILPLQVVFAWVSFYRKCRELGVFGASTLQYPRSKPHPIERICSGLTINSTTSVLG